MEKVTDHLGNVFKNLREMGDYYGIKYETLRKRVKSGMDIGEALMVKSREPIEYNGVKYRSIPDLCSKLGLRISTVRGRLSLGWSLGKAVDGADFDYHCFDHLGNGFETQKKMLAAYGVSSSTFGYRKQQGYDLEMALTGTLKSSRNVLDHQGNKYRSERKMCEAHGVRQNVFRNRRKKGWTLEECLFGKSKNGSRLHGQGSGQAVEYRGVKYESYRKLCAELNVNYQTFSGRKSRGWTMEECILGKKPQVKEKTELAVCEKDAVRDYRGRKYKNIREMCRKNKIKVSTYYKRLEMGFTGEQLFKQSRTGILYDGVEYPTINELCKQFGVNRMTYGARIKKGYSMEEALNPGFMIKRNVDRNQPVQDHLGNEFMNVTAMCEFHEVKLITYMTRREKGLSIKDSLIKDPRAVIYKGESYRSLKSLCEFVGVSYAMIQDRLKNGWSLEEAIKTPNTSPNGFQDHLGNWYDTRVDMCEAYGIGQTTLAYRLRNGHSLEEALTSKRIIVKEKPRHKRMLDGKATAQIQEKQAEIERLRNEILELERVQAKGIKVVMDHNGITYKNYSEMCATHNISYGKFSSRRRRNLPMEVCLSNDTIIKCGRKPLKKLKCKDAAE